VTNVPLTVQTPAGAAVKLTGKPEVAVAATLSEPALNSCPLNGANWMVWAPGVFVSAKLAVPVIPVTLAVTTYGPPARLFARNASAVATPFAPVVAVVAVDPFRNVPLGPEEGAVNSTTIPLTPAPVVSRTVAASGAANGDCVAADCAPPEFATILAGAGRTAAGAAAVAFNATFPPLTVA
jgi:hypothetical protein